MSTGSLQPFQLSGSVTIATNSTSSTSAILPSIGDVLVVSNLNNAPAFVAIGQHAVIGGASSLVVLPMQKRVLNTNAFVSMVSAILTAGSGSVVFEVGVGTVFS
jgi:acyl-[acyl carrier protein]--UDP-N-acetylglucosamine O-acyltransferase